VVLRRAGANIARFRRRRIPFANHYRRFAWWRCTGMETAKLAELI